MYQGLVDFLKDLTAWNAAIYGLAVVFSMAVASLALHGLYTLLFRIGSRLVRRL